MMERKGDALDVLVGQAERIGVIGSPSSTGELSLDILGAAASRKLVGELALFHYLQDGVAHYALGQLTEIELRNIWHEDPTMRSLIRERGRVDAVSERQDTHLGKMVISAVFQDKGQRGYEPGILGTVPPTGTHVHLVTDAMLQTMLQRYSEQLFYLGHVYGSTPKLPLWFKHFGRGTDGAGEAYHLGIFGKTGSGKSVLAKMILVAYARHSAMSLLVLDPQGEFSRDLRRGAGAGEDDGFKLPLRRVLEGLGRQIAVLSVRNLVLDTWELFKEILYESDFFQMLSIRKGENRESACDVLVERLRREGVRLGSLHERRIFDRAWRLLQEERVQNVFYRSRESRERFNDMLRGANPDEFYEQHWRPVAELFNEQRDGARRIDQALGWLLDRTGGKRPVLVVDLSRERAGEVLWSDRIQAIVIRRLLDWLSIVAERNYHEGESLNTLVVIDEAHRLAPRGGLGDDEAAAAVRRVLIDAARTTRKYGLGWLFISQTLSSLHAEIVQQLRILFFGFGLSQGAEREALRQHIGSGPALDLYQLFRDPHSAFDVESRQYSFMTVGPASPLSFSGTPLFMNVFNRVEEFLSANGLEV